MSLNYVDFTGKAWWLPWTRQTNNGNENGGKGNGGKGNGGRETSCRTVCPSDNGQNWYKESAIPGADHIIGCNVCNDDAMRCQQCCEAHFPTVNVSLKNSFKNEKKLKICMGFCTAKN
jgi:hypothetical protein